MFGQKLFEYNILVCFVGVACFWLFSGYILRLGEIT